jgi:hypothetical protein
VTPAPQTPPTLTEELRPSPPVTGEARRRLGPDLPGDPARPKISPLTFGSQIGLRLGARSPDRPPCRPPRPSQAGKLHTAPLLRILWRSPGVGRVQWSSAESALADALEAEVPVAGDQRRDGRPCPAARAVASLGSRTTTTPVGARTHTYLRCAHRGRVLCGNGWGSRSQPMRARMPGCG